MPRKKYYPFLDAVIDVLYSITLYNLFLNFPGFTDLPALIIFFFLTVLMINYWWFSRSIADMPRHYLFDVYFYMIIMFIFTKLTAHMGGQFFLAWLAMLFFMDLIYSIIDISFQKYSISWGKHLKLYVMWNCVLAAYYTVCFFVIKELTILSAISIIVPYVIYLMAYRYKKLMKLGLEYEE